MSARTKRWARQDYINARREIQPFCSRGSLGDGRKNPNRAERWRIRSAFNIIARAKARPSVEVRVRNPSTRKKLAKNVDQKPLSFIKSIFVPTSSPSARVEVRRDGSFSVTGEYGGITRISYFFDSYEGSSSLYSIKRSLVEILEEERRASRVKTKKAALILGRGIMKGTIPLDQDMIMREISIIFAGYSAAGDFVTGIEIYRIPKISKRKIGKYMEKRTKYKRRKKKATKK